MGPTTLGLVPTAALGAWLLLFPGTWGWTGAELGHYDRGMARGLTVAAVLVAVVALGPRVGFPQGRARRRPP